MLSGTKFKSTRAGRYIFEVIRGFDQLANALLGHYARETLSSRWGRTKPNCLLCRFLNYIEADHCLKAARREKPVVEFLLAKYPR